MFNKDDVLIKVCGLSIIPRHKLMETHIYVVFLMSETSLNFHNRQSFGYRQGIYEQDAFDWSTLPFSHAYVIFK